MSAPWTSSESTEHIVPALVASLGDMPAIAKTSTADAGRYTYNYAGIGAVFDVVRPRLKEHGLAITQVAVNHDDAVAVTTTIMHSSGEWLTFASLQMTGAPAGVQALGSVITYLRRYSILSILGVATEDDDGAAAQQEIRRPEPENTVSAADKARGDITFDKLKMIDDDAKAAVKSLANEHDRKITRIELRAYPEWRAHLDALLEELSASRPPAAEVTPTGDTQPGDSDVDAIHGSVNGDGAELDLDEDAAPSDDEVSS